MDVIRTRLLVHVGFARCLPSAVFDRLSDDRSDGLGNHGLGDALQALAMDDDDQYTLRNQSGRTEVRSLRGCQVTRTRLFLRPFIAFDLQRNSIQFRLFPFGPLGSNFKLHLDYDTQQSRAYESRI